MSYEVKKYTHRGVNTHSPWGLAKGDLVMLDHHLLNECEWFSKRIGIVVGADGMGADVLLGDGEIWVSGDCLKKI